MVEIMIEVRPTGHGRFTASTDGEVLCVSRTPLLSAARVLLQRGADPGSVIAMRHVGSQVTAMRGTVGAAARLTIEKSDMHPMRFRVWKPLETRAVRSPAAVLLPEAAG